MSKYCTGGGMKRAIFFGGTIMLLFITLVAYSFRVQARQLSTTNTTASEQQAEQAAYDPSSQVRRTVKKVDYLGMVTFEAGYMFEDTEVGGLSGITYDAKKDMYYVLSDDPGNTNPPRFYTVAITVADGNMQEGDVTFQSVTTLKDESGQEVGEKSLDPEGIVLNNNLLYVCSEGFADAAPVVNPSVNIFSLAQGQQTGTLPIPAKFLPSVTQGMTKGVVLNRAFESITVTPNQKYLYTAVEDTLAQDGPLATTEQGGRVRVVKYDLQTYPPEQASAEWVYLTDPVAEAPDQVYDFTVSGLVELLATDNNGTFLALERSFTVGKGNTVKLYQAFAQGALDVGSVDDLYWEEGDPEEDILPQPFEIDPAIAKSDAPLVNFADLGITPDNVEGMTFGPQLADGRQTLIVVSDNNFDPEADTQVIALALEFETIPVALPKVETQRYINDEDDEYAGDSDDPAIWVHPTDSSKSLVIASLKDGGMVVFDLDGKIKQQFKPDEYASIRYNNVDLVYNFMLNGEKVDLAVFSDRENDTLALFRIDPTTGTLTDVTASHILDTIFGVDDGSHTAYGLTTYTSPTTGKSYAFTCQRDGHLVAQLELTESITETGKVAAKVVRTLELPIVDDNPEDSQAEGMVVDREKGIFYIAMEGEVGILKASAEPDGGDELTVIHRIDESDFLLPDIEGLTIYYGPNGTGYLLVSSQGDSTYAVLRREGNNEYVGSFVVGDTSDGGIDQANESDGADVLNVALGTQYPQGLLVVQDGANDPQNAVEDDEQLENNSTNFKFVPWENVSSAFTPTLTIDTSSYHPRSSVNVGNDTYVYLPMIVR